MEDSEEMLDRFNAWRADPVLFVWQVFGAIPTAQQRQLLEAVVGDNAKVTASSGCGIGKTTALAWLVWWHTILFSPSKCVATAPTKHQLQDCLVPEVKLWRDKMHPWLKEQVECNANKAFVVGAEESQFTTFKTSSKNSPEALQGLHSAHVLALVDEASGVDDIVFEPLKGATGTKSTRVVLTANPTRTTGYFHRTHNVLKHLWTCLRFSCLDSANVKPEYIQEIKDEYGEDSDMYRVRVEGKFPNASICQLIGRDVAEAAAGKFINKEQYNFAPVVVGVDVAWEGNDRSCIVVRQGLATLAVRPFRNVDNMTLAGRVMEAEDEFQSDATFIDVGWGTGVIDYLRSVGRSPVPVNFGGKALGAEYVNKRIEMWDGLRKWLLAGGTIPRMNDLVEDMVGPEYFHAPNGKKGLESKKDMKRRGLPSPDLADALALTFAAPVSKKGEGRPGAAPRGEDGCYHAAIEYAVI